MSIEISPSNKHLINVQALRGIAVIMVILTHLWGIELKHSPDTILPNSLTLGISGVDLFFVISGFIMVYVTWKAPRTPTKSMSFLFGRFTRIFPLYWAIATAVLLGWLVKPEAISFNPETTSVIKSFLLWPDQTLPMLKIAWTLIHELYFYIVFAFILLLPKRWLMPLLCLWVVLVTAGNKLGLSVNPETSLIFNPLGIEFFLGCCAAWIYLSYKPVKGKFILALGILAWIIAYTYQILLPSEFPSNWSRVALFGIPSVLCVYGAAAMNSHEQTFPKWLVKIGDWSYTLYLSHILVLTILGYIWRMFATHESKIDNIIVLPIMFVLTILAGGIIFALVEKPLLSITKSLRRRLFPPT